MADDRPMACGIGSTAGGDGSQRWTYSRKLRYAATRAEAVDADGSVDTTNPS